MNAQELHTAVLAGQMITREVKGTDCSLWLQGGEFVMSKQYGNTNPRHELLAAQTDAARLAAHWDGFCGVEMGTTEVEAQTFAQAVDAAKRLARDTYNAARKAHGGYIAYREAELIASDGNDRSVDEPDYLPFSRLTGKNVRNAVESFLRRAPATTTVFISGGFDRYESFATYVAGDDYEPRVENFDYEIPTALVEMVRRAIRVLG